MSNELFLAVAGNAAGAGLYVEEVFSTYLYTGNGSTQTITNGIDLDGEGGLVWWKNRTYASGGTRAAHGIVDTERGLVGDNVLFTNEAVGASGISALSSFNTDGFTFSATDNNIGGNASGDDYVSWTFRKAPKFFDVVTYTGTGTSQAISHNLGSAPGCLIIKRTDSSSNWFVYHRELTSAGYGVNLNTTAAESVINWFNFTAPTSTQFLANGDANISGGTYVAYLFAHNDGDGDFGESGDQDIIKCGTFTTDGSGNATVDLGWEPQFLITKRYTSTGSWRMLDNMRGWSRTSQNVLYPNLANGDGGSTQTTDYPDATGFSVKEQASVDTYIYIAIRRGPMKTPESGTEVFATLFPDGSSTSPTFVSNFPVDFATSRVRNTTNTWNSATRLTGTEYLEFNTTDAGAPYGLFTFDFQDGWAKMNLGSFGNNWYSYVFRRAPGFFDVVAYTGTGAVQNVAHNLGVAPELLIVKCRSFNGQEWPVQVLGDGTKILKLNSTSAFITNSAYWNDTGATESVFTVTGSGLTGSSGATYIAYLFATVPGVSKVGSYTGNGTSQTIDCGFSAGARFVLIKRTDSAADWLVFDTERGIVAGNDPYLKLNATSAEDSSYDVVDPDSSGFIVNDVGTAFNENNATYIFLAIA